MSKKKMIVLSVIIILVGAILETVVSGFPKFYGFNFTYLVGLFEGCFLGMIISDYHNDKVE